MFDITCSTCQQRYLVGTRSIRAFRNTDEGPVAIVRCPVGHLLEHEFRTRTPQAGLPRTAPPSVRRSTGPSSPARTEPRPGIANSRPSVVVKSRLRPGPDPDGLVPVVRSRV